MSNNASRNSQDSVHPGEKRTLELYRQLLLDRLLASEDYTTFIKLDDRFYLLSETELEHRKYLEKLVKLNETNILKLTADPSSTSASGPARQRQQRSSCDSQEELTEVEEGVEILSQTLIEICEDVSQEISSMTSTLSAFVRSKVSAFVSERLADSGEEFIRAARTLEANRGRTTLVEVGGTNDCIKQ